jgi:hypothetical protein
MDIEILLTAVAVAAALALMVWRFSGGGYGKLRPSGEVTAAYEAFHVDPGKIYYSSGAYHAPSAVMGLDKDWTLESDLWEKRDLDAEGMKGIVKGMRAAAGEHLASLHGFDILDDRGRKIGNWFSLPGMSIAIKTMDEKRVAISTPTIDRYSDR